VPVLLIAPQPFYSDRGTPMNVREMCRVLGANGYSVDVVTYPHGADVEIPGVRIQRCLGIPGVREVPIGFSIRKLLLDVPLFFGVLTCWLRGRHAVIHGVEEGAFLALPIVLLGGARLIYDLDSLISDQLVYSGVVRAPLLVRAIRALERFALRRSAVAITVCRSLTDAARALVPEAVIHQIEDTPLPETLRAPDPRRVAELREEVGSGSRPVVLYTGNLEAYQGVDLAVGAMRELSAKGTPVCLVVVGGADPQREALARQIAVDGLDGEVRLVGPRPATEMADWMGLATILVSPRSRGENTPLKIYSYMASGKPIVATRRLTHTQVLSDETAFLCEPTASGMAAAIEAALTQPRDAQARGSAARRLAEREYSPASFARKLLAAYEAAYSGRC
jgi:glycosyltransferase involved in cell wall biosynthesis